MTDRQYTSFQQKAIRSFYDNRDTSDQQRLSELVADLYLATGKKTNKLWDAASEIMERLGVPESRIAHVVKSGDARVLAEVVNDLQAGRIRKPEATKKPTAPKPSDTE